MKLASASLVQGTNQAVIPCLVAGIENICHVTVQPNHLTISSYLLYTSVNRYSHGKVMIKELERKGKNYSGW